MQGRGGDTQIAHVTPGEMVVPRSLQTPAVMRTLAIEAARKGINPARYTVGNRLNSHNPLTGAQEFTPDNPDPDYYLDPDGVYRLHLNIYGNRDGGPGNGGGQNGNGSTGNGSGGNGSSSNGKTEQNGSIGGININTGGNNSFGPGPADWSNPRDPFGVRSRIAPPGKSPFGREILSPTLDIDFAERIHRQMEGLTQEQAQIMFSDLPSRLIPDFWKNRWTLGEANEPADIGNRFMRDYYATSGQRGGAGTTTLEQNAMALGLRQIALKDPSASIKNATKADPSDLALIQNIDPADFYKGILLAKEEQDYFKKYGKLRPDDYVAPDGQVYRRTTDVGYNQNPLGSVLNSIIGDQGFDHLEGVDSYDGPPE